MSPVTVVTVRNMSDHLDRQQDRQQFDGRPNAVDRHVGDQEVRPVR
jgi:hypothetical protein